MSSKIIAYERTSYQLVQKDGNLFICECRENNHIFDTSYQIELEIKDNIATVIYSPYEVPEAVINMLNRSGYIVCNKETTN